MTTTIVFSVRSKNGSKTSENSMEYPHAHQNHERIAQLKNELNTGYTELISLEKDAREHYTNAIANLTAMGASLKSAHEKRKEIVEKLKTLEDAITAPTI